MEGVVVTAKRPGLDRAVSVTTDAQGRHSRRLNRANTLSASAPSATTSARRPRLPSSRKGRHSRHQAQEDQNLASQLTNAEWMMSIPAGRARAPLLNTGCHTLERAQRSTHDPTVDAGHHP
jgi:hypothetical protein